MGRNVCAAIRGRLLQSRNCQHDEDITGCGGRGIASYACSPEKRICSIHERTTMNRNEKDPNMNLERAIAEMRADQPSAEVMQAASDRVWNSIRQTETAGAVDSIRGCDDVRKCLHSYQAGTLA